MTLYLSVEQVARLHDKLLARFGGARGVRDRGALESAVARPQATFGGEDLYPDLAEKSAALFHSLVMNHPFVDGNKRVGAMAAEFFLVLNGAEIEASDGELEQISLAVARGELASEALTIWLRQRLVQRER